MEQNLNIWPEILLAVLHCSAYPPLRLSLSTKLGSKGTWEWNLSSLQFRWKKP